MKKRKEVDAITFYFSALTNYQKNKTFSPLGTIQ